MAKNLIITGCNGQLAQYFIKYLLENEPDINIIGTVRHKSYDNQELIYDKSKITIELMDLCDPHSIESLIVKYKPDYYINAAANAYVGESWKLVCQQMEINCLAVVHQLEAIRKHSPHTRYLQSGTSEEFACTENNGEPQDETTRIAPRSPYGCAKAASRMLLNVYRKSYNLYAVMNWTFNFESKIRGEKYLTRKVTKGVARIRRALWNNQPFEPIYLGNLHSYRSWQHCSDVVVGLWKTLNQEKPQNYVFSENKTHSIKEFVEKAFKAAAIEGDWIDKEDKRDPLKQEFVLYNKENNTITPLVKISQEFYRPLDVTFLYGDATKARKELGWEPKVTFDELISEMVKHDIENYGE